MILQEKTSPKTNGWNPQSWRSLYLSLFFPFAFEPFSGEPARWFSGVVSSSDQHFYILTLPKNSKDIHKVCSKRTRAVFLVFLWGNKGLWDS